jgi:nucleoid-associated protein YgaU
MGIMTAISTKRTVVPFLIFLACGVALVLAILYGRRQPTLDTGAAPAGLTSALETREQNPAPLAKALGDTKAIVDGLVGKPAAPESNDGVPTFDVASIEPTGETVVAGRAVPGATVELLRDGEVHDRAVADKSGQFVIVPPKLPPGTYDLTLRSKAPDGTVTTSRQRVTAALEPRSAEKPVVALVTPNKPTVVLSQPGAAKPGTDAVIVETVEIEKGGKFHVSGQARPGAALRLYLNDSFIASVTAGTDGRFAVTINEGVAPGNYRVRLDETSGNGAVRSRAEVPFTAPETTASVSVQPSTARRADSGAAQQPQLAAAGSTAVPDSGASASAVVVPKIATTTVTRGDSLWRLSQASYGAGTRYAVIYKANKEQIRNPNLIYPGQVFVMPAK